MTTLLVVGTNTEVGKTVVMKALIARWLAVAPGRLGVMKLVQSGTAGDDTLYRRLFPPNDRLAYGDPLSFQAPLAPPMAAAKEGREIDLGGVWRRWQALARDCDRAIAEGLGSLGSPVTWEWTVADLAAAWRLPVVLVVPVALGAMGQAIAQVALAQQKKVMVRGMVLNCLTSEGADRLEDWACPRTLQQFTGVPVVGTLPYLADLDDPDRLAQGTKDWYWQALGLNPLEGTLTEPGRSV